MAAHAPLNSGGMTASFFAKRRSELWPQTEDRWEKERFVRVQAGRLGTDERPCMWSCQKISFSLAIFKPTASAIYSTSLIIR